jgi:hypothetical protein
VDAGTNPCDDGDPCTIDNIGIEDGICYWTYDPTCGGGATGGYGGTGGIGGIGGSAGFGGSGGYGAVGGSGGYGGVAGSGSCGDGPDTDGDGYQASSPAGCSIDCDDADAHAFPWQQSFFVTQRTSGGFDYDCDGSLTLRWGTTFNACSLDPSGQACVGAGWSTGDPGLPVPSCGQTASYTFCVFTGTECVATVHDATQACR